METPALSIFPTNKNDFSILDITEHCHTVFDAEGKVPIAVFNPSITKIANNEFLISFRINGVPGGIIPIKSTFDPRHPWHTSWKNLIDGTAFMKITLTDEKHIIKTEIINVSGNKDGWIKGVDARLFKHKNVYYLTYNKFTDKSTNTNEVSNTGQAQVCAFDWCANMIIDKYILNNNILTLGPRGIICQPKQQRIEKNWSLFLGKTVDGHDKMNISYGLSDKHIIFKDPVADLFSRCTTDEVKSIYTTLFSSIENNTRFRGNKVIHFSLSTPAIRYDEFTNIAVGHVKLNYNDITNPNFAIEDMNEKNFEIKKKLYQIIIEVDSHVYAKTSAHVLHPTYMYFMFFYKFDYKSGEIKEITNFILPYDKEPHSLVFASGLTRLNDVEMNYENTYIVSYGVADVECKLAFFKQSCIEQLFNLTKIENYPQLIVLTSTEYDMMDTHGGKNKTSKQKYKNKSNGKIKKDKQH